MNEETLLVVQIINTDEADARYWYKNKGGDHMVVRYNEQLAKYETFNSIDNEETIGLIDHCHCQILASYIWIEG